MKDSPLDRIRSVKTRAVESGEDCYSIVVIREVGSQVVLPYSHLRGAAVEQRNCVLIHGLAIVTASGPVEIIQEMARLVSQQRLAEVRHGVQGLLIVVEFEGVPGKARPLRAD